MTEQTQSNREPTVTTPEIPAEILQNSFEISSESNEALKLDILKKYPYHVAEFADGSMRFVPQIEGVSIPKWFYVTGDPAVEKIPSMVNRVQISLHENELQVTPLTTLVDEPTKEKTNTKIRQLFNPIIEAQEGSDTTHADPELSESQEILSSNSSVFFEGQLVQKSTLKNNQKYKYVLVDDKVFIGLESSTHINILDEASKLNPHAITNETVANIRANGIIDGGLLTMRAQQNDKPNAIVMGYSAGLKFQENGVDFAKLSPAELARQHALTQKVLKENLKDLVGDVINLEEDNKVAA